MCHYPHLHYPKKNYSCSYGYQAFYFSDYKVTVNVCNSHIHE